MATITSIARYTSTPRDMWSINVAIGKTFAPEDVIIKAVNNDLEIIAEKWSPNGTDLLASFKHQCHLPDEVDAKTITTQLLPGGKLMLKARKVSN
uniref:heat shock protein beta-7-like n=1 Tax=Styela clava TaxID=7725 RepID=UPI0019397C52|nr:heat shock protein beta-7-like [Styela clava]